MKNTGKSKKILLVVLAVVLLLASITGVMIGVFSSKEEETAAPTIGVVREAEPEVIQVSAGVENNIRDAEVLGLWNDARLGGDGYGPGKTYDNKKASKWNPAACNGYLGDPSIVYLLDGRFDMDRWEMILSARELFFDFYVSSDGQEFTLLQSITKENYQNFYKTEGDRFYLTLETPKAKGIAFVKLCFTGSNTKNNSPWMSVHDVRCIGTRLGDGPSKMPKFEDPYKVDKLELLSYELTGKWHEDQTKVAEVGPARTFDGNIYSMWNPGALPRFEGNPGIIYHLAKPQDIEKMQFYFGTYRHYFNVYVSKDGETYTPIALISFANEDEAYTKDPNGAQICTLDGLGLEDIQHIKLVFTGRSDNSVPWVVLNEVLIFEEGTKGLATAWMTRTEPISTHPWIQSARIIGEWKNNREKDLSWSRYKTYDKDKNTFWNPEAKANYAGNPGVLFTLKKEMDLNEVQFTFGTDPYYFDLYVSKNGKDYSQIADISWVNADKAYESLGNDRYLCTLDSLQLEDVKYIKLVFTGRKNGAPWVSLHEVSLSEGGNTGRDTSWMLRTEPESKHPWIDTSKLIGSWKNDRENDPTPDWNRFKVYDTDKKTFWNPEAKEGYAGTPGIIYTLKEAMSLQKLELTFDDIYYFDLYTTTDGKTFTQIADISRFNEELAYTAGSNNTQVCTLDGLDLQGVTHIKLVFTGRKINNAWVSLYEISLSEEGTEGLDTSWMMTQDPISNHPYIASAKLDGTWNLDRQDDEYWGILQTYDEDVTTFWNPEAKPNYTDAPGVIYTLKSATDIGKLEFNFGSSTNVPYFNVFVSKNGTDYTQIAQITADNEAKAYPSTGLCVLDGLTLEDITHVKLVFTGRKGGSFWISFYEAIVSEEGTAGLDTSWMMPAVTPPEEDEGNVTVASAALTGTWAVSQENNASYSPAKTYDNNKTTYWNPGANSGYTDAPGIVYTLDGSYDLTKLKMVFGNRYMYFDVQVSADGSTYTNVASLNADNYATYYTDGYICTIDGLTAKNVKYIKLVFTGDSQNMCWISFYELDIVGTAAEEPPVTEEKGIASAAITGTWNLDRAGSGWSVEKTADGDTTTFWNPEAKPNYADEPGVIFTLKSAMDIGKLEFNFGSSTNVPYFNVFVSKNGADYTQIARITADNEAKAYPSAGQCVLDGLTLEDITHVKLVFTGRKGGNFWVSFYEATVSEEGTAGLDTSWMLPSVTPPEEDEGNVTVASAALTGTWAVSQENNASYSPAKTYDNNKTTCWNPGANTGYAGNPGIVYTLDGSFDITKLELTFGNRYMYFDVQVSANGSTYTNVASVNADNYATYYTDGYICTIDGLTAKNVKYIKLVFTGDSQNMCWISFYELDIVGTAAEEPPVTEEKGIASAATTGTWNQDRAGSSWSVEKAADGDTTTFWNPEAKPNYTDDPGVIFTLKSAMDIGKLEFNFGTNVPYFNVFVSKNGTDYTQLAQITADNEAKAYPSAGLCMLDGLTLEDITHVKLVFTGRKGGSFWISFYEATVSEEGTAGLDTSWMLPTVTPPEEDEGNVSIASAALTGTWVVTQENNASYSPAKTYDNNKTTYWNPGANTGYAGDPGIVYTLDGSFDITKLELTFGNRYMYFDVQVSADGSTYTNVASLNADNYATYYTDGYVCTIDGLTAKNVKYIKLVFTGDSQNMCWISFYELDIVGVVCVSSDEEP